MIEKVKEKLNDEKGVVSLPFVIAIMAALILTATILEEYQSQMIIRQIEAAADLAAVEALRKNIDEVALRNENLAVDSNGDGRETFEDMDKIRTDFISMIRDSLPDNKNILLVEIPSMRNGDVVIPGDITTASFPNSKPSEEGGSIFLEGQETEDGKRVEYLLDGVTTDSSAMSIVKDTTGLMTANSETKDRTSYFLTAKVLIVYKRYGVLSSARTSILNYVDIFKGEGENARVKTAQIDAHTSCVTIQAIGKVTLR